MGNGLGVMDKNYLMGILYYFWWKGGGWGGGYIIMLIVCPMGDTKQSGGYLWCTLSMIYLHVPQSILMHNYEVELYTRYIVTCRQGKVQRVCLISQAKLSDLESIKNKEAL